MSQLDIEQNQQNLYALLLFRYKLPIKQSIALVEDWLVTHPQASRLTLYKLLAAGKVTFKNETLFDIPELSKEAANALAQKMQGDNGIKIQDRWYNLKHYPQCFVGSEAVDWLMQNEDNITRDEAIALGRSLVKYNLIHHVHGTGYC